MINWKLKRLRVEKGWQQKELAEAAGIARTTLSNIERGHTHGLAENYAKIARVLGVSVDDVLPESETPKVIAALRSLGLEQRRLVVKLIALRGELPLMEDLQELARFKRVVRSTGLDPDSAEFRRWYKTADLDEVREELEAETEEQEEALSPAEAGV